MDAYRDILIRIAAAETEDNDGRWHGVDHHTASLRRLADLSAEAAELAPPEQTDAWTTMVDMNRRIAAMLTPNDAPRPSQDDIAAVAEAMKAVEAHARDDFGIDLFADPPPPVGPPAPIPDLDALDIPDGPVDEAEYERLIADQPVLDGQGEPEHDLARLVEIYAMAAAVAPWNVRPAVTVLATSMRDAVERIADPSIRDRPCPVTPEQIAAASAILSHASRWP